MNQNFFNYLNFFNLNFFYLNSSPAQASFLETFNSTNRKERKIKKINIDCKKEKHENSNEMKNKKKISPKKFN